MRVAHRRAVLAVLALAVVASGVAIGTPTPVFNETNSTANDGWATGLTDGTVDSVVQMAVRSLGYFIAGDAGSSGTVVALVIGLLTVGAVGANRAGLAAGAVAAVSGAYALQVGGFIAPWVRMVVLMLVGLLVAATYFRLKR